VTELAALRLWRLLLQIRQLRIERARRGLHEANESVRRAADETARQGDALTAHHTRRREILAACAYGERSASLWRVALRRHDVGTFGLEAGLVAARSAQASMAERVVAAQGVLRREMRALDHAREQVRELVVAQEERRDDDD
jgi:hypothetical protein